MKPRAAMIFAAGLGTRMGALTADRPKPLIEVGGRPLIDQALAHARDAGADPVVVNVHYRADQLRAHLAPHAVRIADETERLLETGGGLRAALPLLGPGPVWTLNSDAAWTGPNPLRALAGAWRPGMEALLLLIPRSRALGYAGAGDFDLDATGRLARGTGYVYTGAQILRTEGLAEIPDPVFSLNRLWDRAAARGRLHGLVHDGHWCDVGRPENLALAESLLREGAA
ncbi:nucleotidyltransferase family protein [Rubellimicrobium aerolatum]|uniref:Nucleotidyltransferase family protein n=1 Tax=Rubellimicrobium aerolatum TaxID=490979 RepID=A0ABW0SA48_9RHOB|nr:nucleotidyltransferase family protein [Rubellimicrobium aerolatum]MBP1805131.1 MurNAc alpha-1-phosphate uridylyltransferase [Rubellimicrobium aerolatum]